jgi:hypothetical protein
MANPDAKTSKRELGLDNYLKKLSIITIYAPLTEADGRAKAQDLEIRRLTSHPAPPSPQLHVV